MTIEKTDSRFNTYQPFLMMRGYFFEAFNQEKFHQNGIHYTFIQDNQSFHKKTLRVALSNPPLLKPNSYGYYKERS
jgi:dTDP-4-dehydrorhamnose 3,5-epimerase-like enzyme